MRLTSLLRGRARRNPSLSPRVRPSPPSRRRVRRSLSLGPRARPSPPYRRRARRRLALSFWGEAGFILQRRRVRLTPPSGVGRDGIHPSAIGRDRARPQGVGRGGAELLSLEQGMTWSPYASRSFLRSVVIGSTFWGTLVLDPRHPLATGHNLLHPPIPVPYPCPVSSFFHYFIMRVIIISPIVSNGRLLTLPKNLSIAVTRSILVGLIGRYIYACSFHKMPVT